jgi:hypothetical protein
MCLRKFLQRRVHLPLWTASDHVISRVELPERTAYPLLARLYTIDVTLFLLEARNGRDWWLPMPVRQGLRRNIPGYG